METTRQTTPAAHRDRARWRATLSAALASLLAMVRPLGTPPRAASPGTTAGEPTGVPTRAAQPCLMLVESDVCQHRGGLVP
jgi:hypothetical protein